MIFSTVPAETTTNFWFLILPTRWASKDKKTYLREKKSQSKEGSFFGAGVRINSWMIKCLRCYFLKKRYILCITVWIQDNFAKFSARWFPSLKFVHFPIQLMKGNAICYWSCQRLQTEWRSCIPNRKSLSIHSTDW